MNNIWQIKQNQKDDFILIAIQHYFNGGNIYHEIRGVSKFRFTRCIDMIEKLIPHFTYYPLLGYKQLQYDIWLKIFNILIDNLKRSIDRDKQLDY